ncbi:MAG TPA: transcription antitermination factor NusB [Cytophagaceae bacterium]|jgi:N utilization substance protein B|nr:transcription antitermination factor NusB [Cytophagaceae bacterium]
MLNRRLLRVKVMQALYALCQSRESNFELGLEEIASSFLPDLNSMEVQNHELLKEKKEEASVLYEKSFYEKIEYTTQSRDVIAAVENAVSRYKTHVDKDIKHFRKLMLEDVDSINYKYLELLQFLIALADFVEIDEEEKKGKLVKTLPTPAKELKLQKNAVVLALKANKNFEQERIKKNINLEAQFVRNTFKEYLKPDEEYKKYQNLNESTVQEDRDLCLYILKNIFLKKEAVVIHFESEDLNWTENSSIVKSMAVKTIKSLVEGDSSEDMLLDISSNWEEDRAYFLELYDQTVKMDEKLEVLITERVKNWEVDRVALMDKIIIKLATAEMITSPGIPVKVSINEFIEISKIYSTPKSKVFVNGILDSIAADLTKDGTIRKSGRGLIDNK